MAWWLRATACSRAPSRAAWDFIVSFERSISLLVVSWAGRDPRRPEASVVGHELHADSRGLFAQPSPGGVQLAGHPFHPMAEPVQLVLHLHDHLHAGQVHAVLLGEVL